LPNKSIIFVHGAGATPKSFAYIRLHFDGHDLYDFAYDSNKPCREAIDALAALIGRIDGPVVLVGHSLGGVVSVNAACEAEGVSGVVTLASPLGGAKAAQYLRWVFNSALLDDLSPYSANIRTTLARTPPCPIRSFVTVGGALPFLNEANDGVVTVESQRAMTGPEYITVHTNHFEVLLSDDVIALIREFIDKV
jgi:pimeloyl-ACP methyl ester carboxylesterase